MSAKPKFDARKLMEQAIAVMKESISEARADGKSSPLVGALLVKPDGSIETAHRGELRDGDHAEFTLLERKNRANNLAGSLLFATLEPCAPGARSHPKLSCAERIVNARIKEVWVGYPDPDPKVDRNGIKYLQDHGVIVHMFDRDLQDEIKEANRAFLEQALERKAAAEKVVEKVVLSELENPMGKAKTEDFSLEVLEDYRELAKIEEGLGTEGFWRRLDLQGLLNNEKKNSVPTGYGVLLFGKRPRDFMSQAGLMGTIHWPDGTEDVENFEGPMVSIPEQAIGWLRNKLPNPIDRSSARRKDASGDFYKLVREGIVNALVHRDYEIAGAKCQLVVTPDAVTIKSPGKPVSPITLPQMKDFSAPMLSRNPPLHYVFSRMELAEERGLGLKSLKTLSAETGLPQPKYEWEDPYLNLTLYRSASAAVVLDEKMLAELNTSERAGFEWMVSKRVAKSQEYAEAMKVDARTARRHLNKFVEMGIVTGSGASTSTLYRINP